MVNGDGYGRDWNASFALGHVLGLVGSKNQLTYRRHSLNCLYRVLALLSFLQKLRANSMLVHWL